MTRRPNPHQPSCAAFWVRAIADALESEGLDLQALFAEAGLELAALRDPDRRFASDKVDHLWRLALARSGNPTLGLASSKVAKPASFDVVAYTMMSAPNLLGILERMSRYIRIFNDAALVTINGDAEGFRLTLEIYAGQQPVPWQRFGFDLMTFLTFCRWVTARDLRPIALELTLAPSPIWSPTGTRSTVRSGSTRKQMRCCCRAPMPCSLCRRPMICWPRSMTRLPMNMSAR